MDFNFLQTNTDSLFITFEGIEGSGKSTHIQGLANYLESLGKKVIIFREPGGTIAGEKIRNVILESTETLDPLTELFLFLASRVELLKISLKKLKEGYIVIYDRYLDSSLAYQGNSLGMEDILQMHAKYPLNTLPNLTFFLDIDLETSKKRLNRRDKLDYFESRGDSFFKNLINNYEKIEKIFPKRFKRIDSTRDKSTVFNDIKAIIDTYVKP